jgi:hypothetical protein
MGYSCTQAADNMLGVIRKAYGDPELGNGLILAGNKYFYEVGRENADGAITGKLMRMVYTQSTMKAVTVPSVLEQKLTGAEIKTEYAMPAGTFKINADGSIARFPKLSRVQKRELESTFEDMSARNPQLMRSWAMGVI